MASLQGATVPAAAAGGTAAAVGDTAAAAALTPEWGQGRPAVAGYCNPFP